MKSQLLFTHPDVILNSNLTLFILWNAEGELNQSHFVLKHYALCNLIILLSDKLNKINVV